MSLVKIKKQTLTLRLLEQQWSNCTKCTIGSEVRNHVFIDWVNHTCYNQADIVMIGEAPGLAEDFEGLPFVGPTGQLLRECIEEANPKCPSCSGKRIIVCLRCAGYGTLRIALVNLLLCRPYAEEPHNSRNREPAYKEVENCLPRLISTLKLLNPSLVVALGREPESYIPAIRHDLNTDGIVMEYDHLPHPSSILRHQDERSRRGYVEKLSELFNWYWTAHLPRITREVDSA